MSLSSKDVEKKMKDVIENLSSNLRTIRTGRANPSVLDRVKVDYYGEPTPINQVAQISVVEGTQLLIRPYERSLVKEITHAISAANLGLNPQGEAETVRINIPALTQDRRKQLAKEAKKYGDEAKIVVRNIRRDANNAIKKDKEISENEQQVELKKIQDMTDKFVKEIDKVVAAKEKDILTV